MSIGPAVATATVRVVPDTTGFRAELKRQVAAATAGVTATVQAQVAGTAAAASAAAASGIGRGAGASGAKAAGGVNALSKESQALRGSLIGLSRVTPVTVFGLGLYGTAAIAAGYSIKSAIRSTADFEHQLYVFQATTEATAAEMVRVSEEAKRLGADLSLPSTSAGDAAKAMTELAKGGLTVQDTLAASRGVLQLAAAAQLEVGDAAQFVVTQLNAFGLAGEQATHIADLLAGASIAAQGDIRDFGTAFQQVSAVSRQVGLDVETTTGALTALAQAGLKGADSGTSLRTFLLRLTPTTKQAQEYMDALGISYDKTKTVGEQLGTILDQLQASTAVLNETQKTQVLTQIFGQDAIRAAAILVREGSAGLQEYTDAANKAGSANRLAQANAKGLSGAFNGLKSNLDTLGITLGGIVSGPLEDMVRGLGEIAAGATAAADALSKISFPSLPDGLLGERATNIGRSALGKYVKLQLLGPAGFLLSELSRKQQDAPFESAAEKKARLEAARSFGGSIGGISLAGPLNLRAGESLTPPKSTVAPLSPAAAAAVKARVAALNKAKRKVLPADTVPPNDLEIAQLNAQIEGSLQAELKADKAIEAYFRDRLKLAVKGTDRYTKILGALGSANAASRSVQNQINANAAAAAAEQKRAAAEAKRLADQRAADAAQAAKDLLNLRDSVLDLAIQRADYTDDKKDDVTKRRDKIVVIDSRIAALNAIKKKTTAEKQAIVDLRKERLSLLSEIKGLKDDAKTANGSSGFSIEDLFKEALSQFREFGSNVSGSPLTPGQARGGFAGNLIAQITGSARDRKELGLDMVASNTGDMATTLKNIERILSGEPPMKASKVAAEASPYATLHPGFGTALTSKQLAKMAKT